MKTTTLFVLSIFCIVIILFAGCTDNANERAVTTTTVPTSPLQKYSAGDIIAKDSSSTTSAIAILKYDSVHDSYEIYDVTRSDGGSWQSQTSSSTRTLTRSAVEKLYPTKIGSGVSSQPTAMTTTKTVSGATTQQPTSISSGTTVISTTVIPTKDPAKVLGGVAQATSLFVIKGDISAINNPNKNIIGYVSIPIALQDGEMKVDMSQTAVSFRYMNNEVSEDAIATIKPGATKSPNSGEIIENNLGSISTATNIMSSPNWGIMNKNNANSDNLLESGEIFTIAIGVPTTVSPIDHFVVEIRPPRGASVKLDIKTPTASGSLNKLEYSYL